MILEKRNNLNITKINGKKLKVLWLCYFTNSEIQDHLKPWKTVGEIAPWISNMIPLFEKDEAVELHVVSQHEWIPGYKHFKKNGVFYHFFNNGIPIIGRHWPGFFRFDVWSDFLVMRRHFSRIVTKINPDIIHLHGAENEFCTAVTQFYGKYPVFITIQGFISKSSYKSLIVSRKTKNELQILKMFNHFGYRTKTMGEDIKALNKEAVLHWHHYPMNEISHVETDKQFDLVFFAKVCKEKGIEDLLQAVSLIKEVKPEISLCVIGGGKLDMWKRKVKELGIPNNVFWAGFLPTQEDVHRLAAQAKISVLPTYNDIISGTILESLFLKIPVVAYNVGSIHEVNEKGEIITLVEKQNIEKLAESINYLLDHPEICKERAEKGYLRAQEMFTHNDEEIRESLLKVYKEVIKDFKKVKIDEVKND